MTTEWSHGPPRCANRTFRGVRNDAASSTWSRGRGLILWLSQQAPGPPLLLFWNPFPTLDFNLSSLSRSKRFVFATVAMASATCANVPLDGFETSSPWIAQSKDSNLGCHCGRTGALPTELAADVSYLQRVIHRLNFPRVTFQLSDLGIRAWPPLMHVLAHWRSVMVDGSRKRRGKGSV